MKDFFIRYRSPVAVLLAFILIGGVFAYEHIQSSLFPEVTFPKIKVIADIGLQPVDKMMVTVTRPLESAIKRVPGLQNIRSITSRGSCEISAFLDWNTDIDLSKQQIIASIDQVRSTLPPGIMITVEKMNPSILPVMGYVVQSTGLSPIELDRLSNFTVKPYLSQVNGVGDVRVTGGRKKEYRLTLKPERMSALGVTPDAIAAALARTNFIASNGYLFDNHRMYLTVTDANVRSLDALRTLVVSNDGQRIMLLQDLADISIAEQPEYTRINANGQSAVLVAVVKQPSANLVTVSNDVAKRVAELNAGLLPKYVHLQPYYVQADLVNDSIKSVRDSLLVGLALAIMVALLFLRSVRSTLVILITIPITLGLSLIVMQALGYTFNIMTLGALAAAIGLIIDDAIVVVEQIHRTHEENPGVPTRELIGSSVRYLFPAMLGSSLSTIVIFLPFVLLSGVAGAYFKILADTFIITLACSFVVTWIGLPVVYLLMPQERMPPPKAAGEGVEERVAPRGRWITWAMRKPAISLAFLLVIGILAFLASRQLETGFLPEMDEGSIVLDYTSPPGTSLEETDRMLREAEKTLALVPEIETYSRRLGTQMGFFITEPNNGDHLIQLKKDRTRSTMEVIDDIRRRVEGSQPALRIDFGQVIGDMLGDLMSSTQPIEIKVFGGDQHVLQGLARDVAAAVEKVPGAADVFDGVTIAGPSVVIKGNDEMLAQRGMSPQDVMGQMTARLQGTVIGTIFERQQLTPVRMVHPEASSTTLSDLRHAQLFLPNGKLINASEVATLSAGIGEAQIERENLQLMVPVTARLDDRDLGSVMKDIQHGIATNVHLPQGYHITYGGAFQEQQRSFQELLVILLSAGLLVFTVLLFLFRDVRVASLVLALALMGVTGCILALYLTHTPLNVGSYTGIIMIIGIIAENAIFTYLQFAHNRATANVEQALTFAISTRLRPKLMTALGAIIALLPIALGIGTGAQLHQPLAIAVIGGFIIALPLLLIVYPTMLRLILGR